MGGHITGGLAKWQGKFSVAETLPLRQAAGTLCAICGQSCGTWEKLEKLGSGSKREIKRIY